MQSKRNWLVVGMLNSLSTQVVVEAYDIKEALNEAARRGLHDIHTAYITT